MAIKINLKSTKIPIEIGNNKFYYDLSDENLLKLDKTLTAHRKASEQIEKDITSGKLSDPAEIVKIAADHLRVAFDAVLGSGSFDILYKKYPSSGTLAIVFLEVCKEIKEQDVQSTAEIERLINSL